MNAVLHQLKWDFRRIRALWLFWLVILAGATLWSLQGTFAASAGRGAAVSGELTRHLAIYLLGGLLIARLMYTTPFTGAAAFWKTRPLTGTALFWTKTILILLLIETPAFISQWTTWTVLNFDGPFLFWASVHFIFATLSIYLLAAVWAALCERFASFWLGLASTGALLALGAIVFKQTAERVSWFPIQAKSTLPYAPSTSASTILTMFAVLAVTAAVGWLFAGLARNRPATLATLAMGILIAAGANNLWRTDFLNRLHGELPEVKLEATVLERSQPAPEGLHILWSQVAIKLPPGQIAQPSHWHASLSQGNTHLASSASSANWHQMKAIHAQRLHAHYPPGTRIAGSSPPDYESVLGAVTISDNSRGRLSGEAPVTLYEWRAVASLPLQPGARARLSGGGWIVLDSFHDNDLEFTLVGLPLAFADRRSAAGSSSVNLQDRFSVIAFHAPSGTAIVPEIRGYSGLGGGLLSVSRTTRRLELNVQKLRSLIGTVNAEEVRQSVRLDVFECVPIATSTVRFEQDDWAAYHHRDVERTPLATTPKPDIVKTPLPDNPSDAQVDAYLDGVLFTIPENLTRDDWNRIEAELMAIGPAHLDRLLARLPVGDYAENLVGRVIGNLAADAHKPVLLDALRRDPALATFFIQRNWEADAAPLLAEVLRERRPLDYESAPAAVRIVATLNDPDTYDDLYWYFVHSTSGQRDMAEALARCPEFPLDRAIAELWSDVRYELSGRRDQVAALAARIGEKEALRVALIDYAQDMQPNDLALLEQAVEHAGGPAIAQWIHRNFDALTYSPETRKFGLD